MKQENQTKNRLPIQLTIYAAHRLPEGSLTEVRQIGMKATECVFMAEGIFRVIERVCKDAAFADQTIAPNPMPEVMQLAIGHLAQIGTALMTACDELVDQLEIQSEKAKSAKAGG